MQRDLHRLSDNVFDLLIVGGGIYGACAAWDAALRGLSVALIEQNDFGHATSANSQKIIHGGFRYLQSLDLKRMRESIRERRPLLRIAPHLAPPLPFLLPTYRQGIQCRPLMQAALMLYDFIAADRNAGLSDPARRIPAGRLISREECLYLAPGLDPRGLTGGAVWYDGQIYNSERLTLAFVRSAEEHGACVANYVRVTDLLQLGNRITGVKAVDVLTGRQFEIRSRLTLNTSGPWINRILDLMTGARTQRPVRFVKTISVVTRALDVNHSVSVMVPHRGTSPQHVDGCCRRMHITPWRGAAIVGSLHLDAEGPETDLRVCEEDIARLLADLADAYPGTRVRPADVSFVHVGLLPRDESSPRVSRDRMSDHYEIWDHRASEGVDGLLSVVGVKYTTARDVAEKAVTLALKKLGYAAMRPLSAAVPLIGGRIDRVQDFLDGALRARPQWLAEDVIRQLVANYGSEYSTALRVVTLDPSLGHRVVPTATVIKAQVAYAVREEMACRLSDVVLRRTELGSLGYPGADALRTCAELMAPMLGWDAARIEQEIDDVEQVFARMGVMPAEVEAVR